ncbi:MAG: ABC transporter substrate-binding protein [Advenella sp.]|nr:ABC transporter substrate-binding protein [Advenella sp.]
MFTSIKTKHIVSSCIFMAISLFASTSQAQQSLTVYTAGPGTLIKNLASGFESETGIKVNVFQATTGKVMARLEAEAANPRVDLLISASWDTAVNMEQRGLLAPHHSKNAVHVPEQFKANNYIAQGITALGIVWNTNSGTPEPKDWVDLLAPAYRDKVTMPDPSLSGATLDLLLGLQQADPKGAWALLEQLRNNGMVVSGPNAQALTPVLQGAKAAVFGGVDYVTYNSIAQGESVKVVFPTSGTVIAPRPMMVFKSSKRQDEARQFIDYVLSEAGQQTVADAWLMPARSDVGARRPLFKDLNVLPSEQAETGTERSDALQRFNTLIDRH